ncbi:MAG: hypothetical protein HC871_07000 [Rhizobiales bacterium]|nr:hypothetical protein [Hyphomicrobiales bacterium]
MAGGQSIPWLLLGVVLFGLGIGNVTSLPPLIAQAEFARIDVPRAIALATAIAQAAYAFAPAVFGFMREWAGNDNAGGDLPVFFLIAAMIQLTAAAIYLVGRGANRPKRNQADQEPSSA